MSDDKNYVFDLEEESGKMDPRDIPGWGENLFSLYDFAVGRFESGSHFVEVGTFLGMSICYGAQAIKRSNKNIKLECIDMWDVMDGWLFDKETEYSISQVTFFEMIEKARKYVLENGRNCFEAFQNTLEKCKVSDVVVPYNMSSEEASMLQKDNSLDFIVIDADHSYDSVMHDLNLWHPKVKKGSGIISGDDYFTELFPGVVQAVNEFFDLPVRMANNFDDLGEETEFIWVMPSNYIWLVYL